MTVETEASPRTSRVEEITFDTTYYDQTPGEFKGFLHTIPLETDVGKLVIMQALQRQVEYSGEEKSEKGLPIYKFVVLGGGASGAFEQAGVLLRLEQAITDISINRRLHVSDLISVSHPQGSAREQKKINLTDLKSSAELVYGVMQHLSRENPPAGYILWGASAGGGVMIEVAALLEKQEIPYTLVLVDPAATSEHPIFERDIFLRTPQDIYFQNKLEALRRHDDLKRRAILGEPVYAGEDWYSLLGPTFDEMMVSMTTPEGAPHSRLRIVTLAKLGWEWVYQGKKRLDELAKKHGLAESAGSQTPEFTPLKHDTTRTARDEIVNGHVLLVSPIFAKAVNLLIARAGDKFSPRVLNAIWGYRFTQRLGYKLDLYKALQKHFPAATRNEVLDLVHELVGEGQLEEQMKLVAGELFPNTRNLDVMAVPTGLHSGILRSEVLSSIVERAVMKP